MESDARSMGTAAHWRGEVLGQSHAACELESAQSQKSGGRICERSLFASARLEIRKAL